MGANGGKWELMREKINEWELIRGKMEKWD